MFTFGDYLKRFEIYGKKIVELFQFYITENRQPKISPMWDVKKNYQVF